MQNARGISNGSILQTMPSTAVGHSTHGLSQILGLTEAEQALQHEIGETVENRDEITVECLRECRERNDAAQEAFGGH